MGSAAVHRSFVVVDVESYGDPTRTTHDRLVLRDGMYRVLREAFAECDLPWSEDDVDDAGDSLLAIVPPEVPKAVLADHLPSRLAAGLRRHNAAHAAGARMRVRMALHAGELAYDARGQNGPGLILVHRILDAAAAKQALRDSTATLVLIVSDWFYDAVVSQDPATHPGDYRPVPVEVKEVRGKAWVRLVDGHPTTRPTAGAAGRRAAPARPLTLAELGPLVAVLLRTPGFDTREGRDLVLRELPFAASVPRHGADRPDAVSIVRTCAHYPGGLTALVEVIRFYAAGTTEMAELDALMGEQDDDV
ncbi:effector-associated domain 2-containing protein [Saccharothrix xinjiangensis]|uniref:Effector-associated domain-containing protein n=1 Tax=Saccharothrix xinjiangensis TaxID=204798 RepID=A0ABV9YCU0_9PSEU